MIEETTIWKRKHARLAIYAPLAIAVVTQLALAAAVTFVAWSSDVDLRHRQVRTLADYVEDLTLWEGQSTLDLALWNEFDAALEAQPIDRAWLDDRLMETIATYANTVTAAVLDPAGVPIWVAAKDRKASADHYRRACPDCDRLADVVRERAMAADGPFRSYELSTNYYEREPVPDGFPLAVALSELDGRPVVVAAAAIDRMAAGDRSAGPHAVLVTVVDLADGYVRDMIKETGIAGIRVVQPGAETAVDGVPLTASADGRPIGMLTWPFVTPGRDLLQDMAPILLLCHALFTALVVALVRWLKRMAVDQLAGEALGNHLATHDPLTGLGNRALLAVELDRALPAAVESGRPLALALIDLDGFKGVNDTHGHAAGDELIRQFADRLVQGLPDSCRIARLGGDEFAVLLPDLAAPKEALALAADMIAFARVPFDVDGVRVRIGCSIGLALAPAQAQDRSELLRKADVALYRAKDDGRNRVCAFRPELDDRVQAGRSAEDALRAALGDEAGFDLAYDALYSLAGDQPAATIMKASLHVAGRPAGLTSARALLRTAEEVGLAGELGTLALRRVCRDAALWPERLMCVDVSPLDVAEPGFADRVLMVLDEAGVAPGRLELELIDGLQHANSREALAQLARLRGAGVSLSLDRFGAGYANISQLRALPLTRVTIAGMLLRGLPAAADARHIVLAIVDLCRSSGLQVAAEGVDRPEQIAFLKSAGCNLVRGRALPPVATGPSRRAADAPRRTTGAG